MTFVPLVATTVFVCGAVRALLVVVVASVALGAFEPALDPRAIDQAVAIGLSRSDRDRAEFHRRYRAVISRPPVDWLDVITPFRRVALATEARMRDGGRLFGQREALDTLGADPQRIDIVVELTFHPLNTFVGVPGYHVALQRQNRAAATPAPEPPTQIERIPRFGPRVSGTPLPYPFGGSVRVPRGSEPLLGGTIVAVFDGRAIPIDGLYDVIVSDGRTELARTRIDFAALR